MDGPTPSDSGSPLPAVTDTERPPEREIVMAGGEEGSEWETCQLDWHFVRADNGQPVSRKKGSLFSSAREYKYIFRAETKGPDGVHVVHASDAWWGEKVEALHSRDAYTQFNRLCDRLLREGWEQIHRYRTEYWRIEYRRPRRAEEPAGTV